MVHKVYKVKAPAASSKWRIRSGLGAAKRGAGGQAYAQPSCPPSGTDALLPQPGKELDLLHRLIGLAAVMLVEWPDADVFRTIPVVVGGEHG
jgi:hypothetical protein